MLPMSRGESFLENRVFSNPDEVEWGSLDLQTRRDFVKHSDRGVFDPPSLEAIAYDDRCPLRHRPRHRRRRAASGEGVRARVRVAGGGGRRPSTTTSSTAPASTCSRSCATSSRPSCASEIERQAGPLWDRPAGTEVRIGRALELEGMQPRLHIPGLAGLSQGPGFANLGALGLLSNRVLQPLLPEGSEQGFGDGASLQYKSLSFE